MIQKLNDLVWFGDWKSPIESIGKVHSIINVAHHFSARRGRDQYWNNLRNVPHEILYIRLALRDADNVNHQYALAFRGAIELIKSVNAFPLLCHCAMGRHRGPTAALHAAVLLGANLEETNERLLTLSRRLRIPRDSRRYYPSTLDYLRKAGYK